MGMGQFLNYSGDNEPQDDSSSGSDAGGPSSDGKGWIGCLIIIVVIGGSLLWYYAR